MHRTTRALVVDMVNRRTFKRFAESRGYTLDKQLKAGKVYRLTRNQEFFALKKTTDVGIAVLRDVIPNVRSSPHVLPHYVESGKDDDVGFWVITRWCPGRNFEERWSADDPLTAGGRAIDIAVIPRILDALQMLHSLDLDRQLLPPLVRLHSSKLRERLNPWVNALVRSNWLANAEANLLLRIIDPMIRDIDVGRCILTNGDFQLKNFVENSDGSLLVLDWDTARYSSYEIEHCVSYQWLLMWNNSKWQQTFLQSARNRFTIERQRFRSAFVRNALMRVVTWRRSSTLRGIHLDYLKLALEDQGFDSIWWN